MKRPDGAEIVVHGLEDAVRELKALSKPFLNWAGKAERLSFQVPSLPLFVHATEPPGVATMKERRAQMSFRYEEVDKGGKVVVQTDDTSALAALHEFLRFQIREHKTGDPLAPR